MTDYRLSLEQINQLEKVLGDVIDSSAPRETIIDGAMTEITTLLNAQIEAIRQQSGMKPISDDSIRGIRIKLDRDVSRYCSDTEGNFKQDVIEDMYDEFPHLICQAQLASDQLVIDKRVAELEKALQALRQE